MVIVPSDEGGAQLAQQAEAVNFLRDAYGHLKVIGYLPSAAPMLAKAGIDAGTDDDPGLVVLDSTGLKTFIERARGGRIWAREPKVRMVP